MHLQLRVKNIFKNFFSKSWQHQKNKFIFALAKQIINKQMLRIQSHIERVNQFSPKGDCTVCGAHAAVE